MNTGPVSVILCTYNGERFLREQLDTIRNQTYTALEIIISDDASTDTTWAISLEYAAKDPRIKLYRNENNTGFTANFNKAVTYATAAFLAFADQDDVWHPRKIETMMQQLPSGCTLVYCNAERFTGPGYTWDQPLAHHYRRFAGTDPRKLAVFNTVSGHAMLIRSSLVPLVFPVTQGVMYDWYAAVVAACNGGVHFIPETLVLQRVHPRNATVASGYEFKKGKVNRAFKELVSRQLHQCIHTPNMPSATQAFFSTLAEKWDAALHKSFSQPLFFFIIRYREIIFWKKRRGISLLSAIKHTYRLIKN